MLCQRKKYINKYANIYALKVRNTNIHAHHINTCSPSGNRTRAGSHLNSGAKAEFCKHIFSACRDFDCKRQASLQCFKKHQRNKKVVILQKPPLFKIGSQYIAI